MRVALKGSIFFVSRLCNRHRTLGGECSVESKTLVLLHHTDSSEGGDGELYSSGASTGINNRGGSMTLLSTWSTGLNFSHNNAAKTLCRKRKGDGHSSGNVQTYTNSLPSSPSWCWARKRPRWCFSLIYANPILQFSHNGVLLPHAFTLSGSPTHSSSAWHPSQEFPPSIICLG